MGCYDLYSHYDYHAQLGCYDALSACSVSRSRQILASSSAMTEQCAKSDSACFAAKSAQTACVFDGGGWWGFRAHLFQAAQRADQQGAGADGVQHDRRHRG